MKNQIELTTAVKMDSNGDEYYVVSPREDLSIRLSDVTFLIFHPEEGSSEGTLIIKQKDQDRRAPSGDPALLFLAELQRAEERFKDGYINYRYFLSQWKSMNLPRGQVERQKLADQLLADGKIETYVAADGKEAVRTTAKGQAS